MEKICKIYKKSLKVKSIIYNYNQNIFLYLYKNKDLILVYDCFSKINYKLAPQYNGIN